MSAIENLRNIGIVAHIDAGKTTTTERILFYSGASHRMGEVDQGTTATDFDPEEARRGITIYSAAITCHWAGTRVNIIDTPGHVDFTAEVERSLRVLDGAIVIFSAVEGVEAQSETVWRQADRYDVPRICFINKMDRIGAGFERVLNQMTKRLQCTPVALMIPIGSAHEFKGIIDLIRMKALYFDPEERGQKFAVEEIPEEEKPRAEEWRAKLLEAVSMLDDSAMERYLESGSIPEEDIDRLLRTATLNRTLQPVYCGSSLDFCGVQPLLDGVVKYLPSPLDRPPVEGENPNPKKEGVIERRKPTVDEPLSALVFKIQSDQHADLCFARIYSGRLKAGTRVLNARTGKKELVSQLWHIQADQRQKLETDSVDAGDIVGIIGPKDVVTGDTLCDAHKPILLESITFPETVISMAVEPDSSAERKKLEEALTRLGRQDPTFRAQISEETGQTIISGMGELHLEVLRERLQRDYNLQVRVHKPRVSYRETVRKPVRASGTYTRTTQGETQFAEVTVTIEPHQGEQTIEYKNALKPNALPPEMRKALDQAIKESLDAGGILGYPLMHIRLTVVDVDYRDAETTEDALRAAAAHAVQEALNEADIALLEPIMKLEVTTPEEFVGNIQGDLNTRHAMIVGSEHSGNLTVLQAEAPLANMFGYSTQVRSLSQGRASYSMEPLKYDFAPESVLKEMIG